MRLHRIFLPYGVTVAHLILVQLVWVRILVGQQKSIALAMLFCCLFRFLYTCPKKAGLANARPAYNYVQPAMRVNTLVRPQLFYPAGVILYKRRKIYLWGRFNIRQGAESILFARSYGTKKTPRCRFCNKFGSKAFRTSWSFCKGTTKYYIYK